MDQYLSTYRKDYLWPYVKTYPLRSGPTYATDVPPRQVPCMCGTEAGGNIPPKEYVGPAEGGSYEWSRLGPMGPLLDPKLYPAKVGPIPESKSTQFDQPSTYLKKVFKISILYYALYIFLKNTYFQIYIFLNIERLSLTSACLFILFLSFSTTPNPQPDATDATYFLPLILFTIFPLALFSIKVCAYSFLLTLTQLDRRTTHQFFQVSF